MMRQTRLSAALIVSLGLASAMPLSGCVGTGSEAPPIVAAPRLPQYSPAFQSKLADEMEAAGQECGRDVVVPPCSALLSFALDAIWLRDQLREMGR